MIGKLKARKHVQIKLLLGFLLSLSAAAFFLLSLAGAAPAVQGAWGKANTVTGKIIDVDIAHPTKSLTIQSGELGPAAPNHEMNIFLNDKTSVKMCYAARSSVKDLKEGAKMQVTYHEIAGLAVADFIYKPC